jgi:hypothetical protein
MSETTVLPDPIFYSVPTVILALAFLGAVVYVSLRALSRKQPIGQKGREIILTNTSAWGGRDGGNGVQFFDLNDQIIQPDFTESYGNRTFFGWRQQVYIAWGLVPLSLPTLLGLAEWRIDVRDTLNSWDTDGRFTRLVSTKTPSHILQLLRTWSGVDVCQFKGYGQVKCQTLLNGEDEQGDNTEVVVGDLAFKSSAADGNVIIYVTKINEKSEVSSITLPDSVGETRYFNTRTLTACHSLWQCDQNLELDYTDETSPPILGTMCAVDTNLSAKEKFVAMVAWAKKAWGPVGEQRQVAATMPDFQSLLGVSCEHPIYTSGGWVEIRLRGADGFSPKPLGDIDYLFRNPRNVALSGDCQLYSVKCCSDVLCAQPSELSLESVRTLVQRDMAEGYPRLFNSMNKGTVEITITWLQRDASGNAIERVAVLYPDEDVEVYIDNVAIGSVWGYSRPETLAAATRGRDRYLGAAVRRHGRPDEETLLAPPSGVQILDTL